MFVSCVYLYLGEGMSKMSELFVRERNNFQRQWNRTKILYQSNRGRYANKTAVLKEALDILEEKLTTLKK